MVLSSFVWRSNMGKVLNDFLCVLCLPGTRFTPGRNINISYFRKRAEHMCSKITIDKMKLNRVRIRERKRRVRESRRKPTGNSNNSKESITTVFLWSNLATNTTITEPSWKIVIFLVKYILDNELWVAKKDLLLHLSFIFPTTSIGTHKPVFMCVCFHGFWNRVSYCSQV